MGEAMAGIRLGGRRRHRSGDFRVIATIEDRRMANFVVRIGKRRNWTGIRIQDRPCG
jgi:mRNA-degrading endonuclease RelE of RelBE toxin-antitoxin system